MALQITASSREEFRTNKTVMVTEASALGMIAVIRSLGRAGYQVHACSSDASALGLRSSFATQAAMHPPYSDPGFLPWLSRYIETNNVEAIVPSESFLIAIRPVFNKVRNLLTIGPDEETIYRCFSKHEVLEQFFDATGDCRLRENLPPSFIWKPGQPLPDARELARLGLPLFIKTDGVHAVSGGTGTVVRAETAEEAVEAVRKLGSSYSSILIQGFVAGTRVVADFCIWKGQVRSRSMMVARHENPHYGGVSTLRSVTWEDDLALDAEIKLRHLGLEGVAMMEYRRDPHTGRFHFIEINARYWLGLHVEIMSGIDIPLIQIDAFFDRFASAPDPDQKATLVRYTIPGDIGYVLSLLKDKAISLKQKAWAVLEFILLCLDPRVKSDFNFPGDRKLYYLAFFRFFWSTLLRRS